jgi:hypothetical protein
MMRLHKVMTRARPSPKGCYLKLLAKPMLSYTFLAILHCASNEARPKLLKSWGNIVAIFTAATHLTASQIFPPPLPPVPARDT